MVIATLMALLLNEDFRGRRLLSADAAGALGDPLRGQRPDVEVDLRLGLRRAERRCCYQLGFIDKYMVWLGDADKTLALIANAFVWKEVPLATILLLVTMKSIPADLYSAAKVDGANVWQRFLHITLPSLRPGFALVMIYETMMAIRHFDLFFILTEGGPAEASHVVAWEVYVETFRKLSFGTGAALAYIMAHGDLPAGLLRSSARWGASLMNRLDLRRFARPRAAVRRLAAVPGSYVLAPIAWLVSSSFQSEAEITSMPPHWIPHQPTLENFAAIFKAEQGVTYETRQQGDTATGGFIPSTAKNLLPAMWNSLIVACRSWCCSICW